MGGGGGGEMGPGPPQWLHKIIGTYYRSNDAIGNP